MAVFFVIVFFVFAFVPIAFFCVLGLVVPLLLWLSLAGLGTIHGWNLPGEGQTLVGFVATMPIVLAMFIVAGGIEYAVRIGLDLAPPSLPPL